MARETPGPRSRPASPVSPSWTTSSRSRRSAAPWDPIPEPWVTLGALAAARRAPARHPRLARDLPRPRRHGQGGGHPVGALGRTCVRRGRCGWWEREHAAYGLEFPSATERLDALERGIETMRALWAPGTKPYAGQPSRCPRPPSTPDPSVTSRSSWAAGARGRCASPPASVTAATCPPTSPAITASGPRRRRATSTTCTPRCSTCPLVGRDRDDTWRRVEALRGRTAAATFAARTMRARLPSSRAASRPGRARGVDGLRGAGGPGVRGGPGAAGTAADLSAPNSVAPESPSTRRAMISCWICWVPSNTSRISGVATPLLEQLELLAVADRPAPLDAAQRDVGADPARLRLGHRRLERVRLPVVRHPRGLEHQEPGGLQVRLHPRAPWRPPRTAGAPAGRSRRRRRPRRAARE